MVPRWPPVPVLGRVSVAWQQLHTRGRKAKGAKGAKDGKPLRNHEYQALGMSIGLLTTLVANMGQLLGSEESPAKTQRCSMTQSEEGNRASADSDSVES